jgi:hypothetical protein
MFGRRRDGDEGKRAVRLVGKNGGEGGKCDLKQVLERFSLSAFERTKVRLIALGLVQMVQKVSGFELTG